jgi:hypothetical protein
VIADGKKERKHVENIYTLDGVMTNTTQIEYYPVYHLQSDVISA